MRRSPISPRFAAGFRRYTVAILACTAAVAVGSNLLTPFASRVPGSFRWAEGALAIALFGGAVAAVRRTRGWPRWNWALGFLTLGWALAWGLASLRLRSGVLARWFAPAEVWTWLRWAPAVGALSGALLMAGCLRVRGRR